MGRKNRSNYIPSNAIDTYKISSSQKNSAKKAIIWLLSKAYHTTEEIADHYEMSPELINDLLHELIIAKKVVKIPGRPPKFKVANKKQNNISVKNLHI